MMTAYLTQPYLPGLAPSNDVPVAPPHQHKHRIDWGLDNMLGMEKGNVPLSQNALTEHNENAVRLQRVRGKIANFIQTAVHPQQLTVPRQYCTTQTGTFLYKVVENRYIDRVAGGGTRVVVQENKAQARFIISPLFGSRFDAVQWAIKNTGAEIPKGIL